MYPTNGSVKREPRGCNYSSPPPTDIPLLGVPFSYISTERKPCTLSPSTAPPPTHILSHTHDGSSNGPATNPPPDLYHSKGNIISLSASPVKSTLLLSFALHTPLFTGYPRTGMVGIPYLPSLPCWYAGQPVQTSLSECTGLPLTRLAVVTP